MAAEVKNDFPQRTEAEPGPAEIALITGGTGGIGREVAKRLAKQGKRVIIGTRNPEKFERISSEIEQSGGISPAPFIADITDPSEIATAYQESGLKPGQAVDYYALAAGGLDAASIDIGRVFVGLMRQLKTPEGITPEAAEEATQRFREIMTRESVVEAARQINLIAPVLLGRDLEQNGNLNKNSRIVYLGSTISEYTREILEWLGPDEAHQIDNLYPGPEHYRVVGIYKAQGILGLQNLAKDSGAVFYNFVAPGVTDTPIGNFFGRFVPVLKAVHRLTSDESFEFPAPSASEVADVIVTEIGKPPLSHENTLYIGYHPGEISSIKPSNFRVPIIDFL